MKRVVVAGVALFAAVLIQLTILNGLPLPGGGTPNLVLLCVVALGLTGGTQAGLIAGFCAGLTLDLAPPASELVGQYALVLCLAGYLAGKMRFTVLRSAALAIAVAAVAAAAGEALAAALALALDTPEVTLATVARVLPSSLLYDVVVSPIALFAAVRVAAALGASFSSIDDSPALESGGSAAPGALAAAGSGGVPRARIGAGSGGSRAAASGRWLIGDVAFDAPAVGAIGWLAGPARSRRARREQARLTATLTGASPRKGAFWVGGRPAGLVPVMPPPAPRSSGLARLRLRTGVAGSAAAWPGSAGHLRPVRPSRPVRLGLADEQRRLARTASRRWRTVSRTAPGRPEAGLGQHGLDRHGLNGPDVRRVAFGTGGLAGSGQAVRPRVPKIAFGGGAPVSSGQTARQRVPKTAFGFVSGPGKGRAARSAAARSAAARSAAARAALGTGRLPGAWQARKVTPKIAFRSPGLAPGARTSPGRPAAPRFRAVAPGFRAAAPGFRAVAPGFRAVAPGFRAVAPGFRAVAPGFRAVAPGFRAASTRSATGQWLAHLSRARFWSPRAGSGLSGTSRTRAGAIRPGRRTRAPRFARGGPGYAAPRSRQPKTARMRPGRWPLRRLPWLRRAGGRSTVWRIAAKRTGGYR